MGCGMSRTSAGVSARSHAASGGPSGGPQGDLPTRAGHRAILDHGGLLVGHSDESRGVQRQRNQWPA